MVEAEETETRPYVNILITRDQRNRADSQGTRAVTLELIFGGYVDLLTKREVMLE